MHKVAWNHLQPPEGEARGLRWHLREALQVHHPPSLLDPPARAGPSGFIPLPQLNRRALDVGLILGVPFPPNSPCLALQLLRMHLSTQAGLLAAVSMQEMPLDNRLTL